MKVLKGRDNPKLKQIPPLNVGDKVSIEVSPGHRRAGADYFITEGTVTGLYPSFFLVTSSSGIKETVAHRDIEVSDIKVMIRTI